MKNSITTQLAPGLLLLALTAACGQPVTQESSTQEPAKAPTQGQAPAQAPAPEIDQPKETVLPSLDVGQQAMPASLDSKVGQLLRRRASGHAQSQAVMRSGQAVYGDFPFKF